MENVVNSYLPPINLMLTNLSLISFADIDRSLNPDPALGGRPLLYLNLSEQKCFTEPLGTVISATLLFNFVTDIDQSFNPDSQFGVRLLFYPYFPEQISTAGRTSLIVSVINSHLSPRGRTLMYALLNSIADKDRSLNPDSGLSGKQLMYHNFSEQTSFTEVLMAVIRAKLLFNFVTKKDRYLNPDSDLAGMLVLFLYFSELISLTNSSSAVRHANITLDKLIVPKVLDINLLMPFTVLAVSGSRLLDLDTEGDNNTTSSEVFTEESASKLLASDSEELDMEWKDADDSTAASDSYCSANSSYGTGNSTPAASGPPQLARAHNAIRAARLARMSTRSLSTGLTYPMPPLGALVEDGDNRTAACFLINSFTTNRNISATFDTGTLVCVTCGYKPHHKALFTAKEAVHHRDLFPAVFVLCDQSFPASAPTGGEGECLKILRLEDGSLADLTDIFLETVKPFLVPAGSIVLIHSLSHLAWVGPAAYAEDLVRARQRICAAYRSGLFVLSGLPLPAGGCPDTNLVRDLTTVSDWADCARHPAERDIGTTRALWKKLIFQTGSKPSAEPVNSNMCSKPSALPPRDNNKANSMPSALLTSDLVQPSASGSGRSDLPSASAADSTPDPSFQPSAKLNCTPSAQGSFSHYSMRMRLPSSLDSMIPTVFSLDGPASRVMVEIEEATERSILGCLIEELNAKFNASLDHNFSTSRTPTDHNMEAKVDQVDFIMIGSSHAHRLASALKELGENVHSLASPSWRLNEENVTGTAAALAGAVKNNPQATVILQIYDSSIYFSSSEAGELTLPKRGEDGAYHINGELVLAEWSALKKIFNMSAPLLRAAGTCCKIVLSPLPRYATSKCCEDKRHLTNYGTRSYATSMGNSLAEIHSWLDDLAHGKRISNYEVMCPSSAIGLENNPDRKQLAKLWGNDPVHLAAAGYIMLAEKIVDKAADLREKSTPTSTAKPHPLRQAANRLDGVSRSDLAAPRWGPEPSAPRKRSNPDNVQDRKRRH